jgi:hypothetical protein
MKMISSSLSSSVYFLFGLLLLLLLTIVVTPTATAAAAAAAFSPAELWTLRIASATASYIGLITALDRPRGELLLLNETGNWGLFQKRQQEGKERILEVRPSLVVGAGLGLFAAADLPQGTVLGTYPGVVLPLQQNLIKLRLYPACEAYVWRFSDNQYVIDPTNHSGVLDDVCVGGNPSTPLSQWLFASPPYRTIFGGTATDLCRINEPPRGFDVNVVTDEDRNRRCVTFTLERDVSKDEELYIDYGLSYDRSLYGGGGDGVVNCNGGKGS